MARKEFTYPVGGSGDSPISTTQTEAFEVDNYDDGTAFTESGASNYPATSDPAFTIEHVAVFALPTGATVDLVTSSGVPINGVDFDGAAAYIDGLELDSITVNDPNGNGEKTSMLLVGE